MKFEESQVLLKKERLAHTLESLRKAEGLSYKRLLQEALNNQVSINTYRAWINPDNNTSYPSLNHIIMLANRYNITIDSFWAKLGLPTSNKKRDLNNIVYEELVAPITKKDQDAIAEFEKTLGGSPDPKDDNKREEDHKRQVNKLLLQHAIDRRLIHISGKILNERNRVPNLEQEIKRKYPGKLKEVFVFDFAGIKNNALRTILLAIATTPNFVNIASKASTIGISNGSMVQQVVNQLKLSNIKDNVTIFPIVHEIETEQEKEAKFAFPVEAPFLVSTLVSRLGVEYERNVNFIKSRIETCDVILMSLGSLCPDNPGLIGRILKEKNIDIEQMWNDDICGDILFNLYHKNGTPLERNNPYNINIKTVGFVDDYAFHDALTRIKSVVAVVASRFINPEEKEEIAKLKKDGKTKEGVKLIDRIYSKGPITRVAISQKKIDVLSCDSELAEYLCQYTTP